jgi:hypothetical protein
MNPTNGKGSGPRKGRDQKKYESNFDRIFGQPRKETGTDQGQRSVQQADTK